MEEELKQFDFVQFAMCDVHGTPRGKLIPREMLSQACRDGVGIFSGTQYLGFNAEPALSVKAFQNFPNGIMRPLAGTVRPLEWCSAPKRRIGAVLCQLELGEMEKFEECPRQVAQRQVDRLAKKGFKLKSAYECEFDVVRRDNQEPLGDCPVIPYGNLDLMDRNLDLLTDMLNVLRASGVRLEYFFPEYQAGQYEASMQPQWGVGSADDAFMFRYGVRSYCYRQGLQATFMPIPYPNFCSAGLHFNHSLWSQDGHNVFHDPTDPLKLSTTARHWIAGLLEHAPALTALCCPTLNCYRRLGRGFAPGPIYWNIDDRLCTFRAKITGGNVYLENRVPSSAGNPYLVLAATIAAGLDGVHRQLAWPSPGCPESQEEVRRLPGSLADALEALEKDEVLIEALGGKVVEYFLAVKQDIEIKHFQAFTADDVELVKQREYYMAVM
ncbi:glutamine synthetase-like [Babylonia areolata]|uniref:glutamine synthetase-like n=1 Tax=Babylonia areolata TaxID=304850 RepID=UPI003FD6AE1F